MMEREQLDEVLARRAKWWRKEDGGERASLNRASLDGASLVGAIMPDGRTWEAYKLDPLAGICDEPEARKRAIAAWGSHTWGACPMHMAHGWNSISDAPGDKRIAVAAFVALFDSRLLPEPEAFEARK